MTQTARMTPTTAPTERASRPKGMVSLTLITLLTVVLAASIGTATSLLYPTKFSAHAQLVYLIGAEQPTGFLREDRNLATQVELLRSRTVLEPVATAHGHTSEDLAENLHIEIVPGTEVLNLRVDAPSKKTGRSILEQLITRYTAVSDSIVPSEARAYLEQQLDDVRGRMNGSTSETERESLVGRELTLLNSLDSVNLAGARVKLVVPPYSAASPASPQPLFGLATGTLIGVLIAGCLILWRARRWVRG